MIGLLCVGCDCLWFFGLVSLFTLGLGGVVGGLDCGASI